MEGVKTRARDDPTTNNPAAGAVEHKPFVLQPATTCPNLPLKRSASEAFPDPIPQSPSYEDLVKHTRLLERANERLRIENTALRLERCNFEDKSGRAKPLTIQPRQNYRGSLDTEDGVQNNGPKKASVKEGNVPLSQNEHCQITVGNPSKLRQQAKTSSRAPKNLRTLNEGLQLAIASIAQDKQKVEHALRESNGKVECLTAAKDKSRHLYPTLESHSTRVELELRSSLHENLEKVTILTDESEARKLELKALVEVHAATKEVVTKRDLAIQQLKDINSEQHAASTSLESVCKQLRERCEGLRSSNAVFQQHNQALERRCAGQEGELGPLRSLCDELDAHVEDLEGAAAERKRLAKANTKSRKRVLFAYT